MTDLNAINFLIDQAAEKARLLAGEIGTLERSIMDLERNASEIDAKISKGLARGSASIMSQLFSRSAFVKRERLSQASLRQKSAHLRGILAIKRKEQLGLFSEKKRFEVLRDRQIAEAIRLSKKRQAKAMDDIAIQRHARRKHGSPGA